MRRFRSIIQLRMGIVRGKLMQRCEEQQEEKIVRDLIPKLRSVGAEGIIEYPLNKVIP